MAEPGRDGARHLLLWLALGVALLVTLELFGLRQMAGLEARVGDQLLRWHAAGRAPDPAIVIVDIDDRSLELMATEAGRYPWSRAVHAELVEGIMAQGPRTILFDIMFSEPDQLQPEGDAWLVEVAGRSERLFFPLLYLAGADHRQGLALNEYGLRLGFQPPPEGKYDASRDDRVALDLPLAQIALTGRIGAINFRPEADGVGRHYWLYLNHREWGIPSLPARVAQALGAMLPEQQAIRLNWHGQAMSYPRISYADIYQDLSRREPQRSREEFRDKVVIIGASAAGLGDLRTTPLASTHPAYEMIATALDNLLNDDWLYEPSQAVSLLLALLFIALLYSAFRRWPNPLPIGGALLLLTPLPFVAAYLALQWRQPVAVLTPVLAAWSYYVLGALYTYRRERRAREHSIQLFGRFLDPRVVKALVAQGERPVEMRGESREVTVLFSDIRGFTTLSEQHSAEQVVELLNDYFSRQVRVIFAHGGTVDKFIGDAIMAFWGAPVSDERQAEHAVHAALAMADALAEFRASLPEALRGFDIGIGIHTGPAVVGFIGSDNRLDYTAIGDTVNLASRIEGQTKGVARILVSEQTRERCGEVFDFVDHGSYKVKGRSQEVRLYEPRPYESREEER